MFQDNLLCILFQGFVNCGQVILKNVHFMHQFGRFFPVGFNQLFTGSIVEHLGVVFVKHIKIGLGLGLQFLTLLQCHFELLIGNIHQFFLVKRNVVFLTHFLEHLRNNDSYFFNGKTLEVYRPFFWRHFNQVFNTHFKPLC